MPVPPAHATDVSSPMAATVARLRMLIVDGALTSQHPTPIADVAAWLGVDEDAAIVALMEVGRDGFLERVGADAVRVSAPVCAVAEEVLQVRRLLEPVATRTAAEHVRSVDLLGLRALADSVETALSHRDPSAFRRADDAFSSALLALHPNGELARLCADLRARTPSDGMRLPIELGLLSDNLHAHRRLVDCIEAGDLDAVESLTLDHIERLRFVGAPRMDAPHLRGEVTSESGADGEFLEVRGGL